MGNGGGNNNKSLMITVATAGAAGTQMNVASGGGGGTALGAGGDSKKDDKKNKDKDRKDNQKGLMATLGIQFTLGAMLKQSQIFTGFLGSVFQLIGALVDVILAPLAPYLFKLVEIMASWIPKIGEWSQKTVDWLKNLFVRLAEVASGITGMTVSAGDLVQKGFQVLSLSGFAMLLGSNFAASLSGKPFTFGSVFSKSFKESDILSGIKGAMTKGGKVIGALTKTLKNIIKAVMSSFGTKIFSIGAKFLKGAGAIGMIIGIAFELKDIIQAFKDGKVGEAVFKIVLAVIGLGIPIALGLAFGAIPALIGSLIFAAVALLWEFAVPQDVKDKVYDWIGGLFTEIKDVLGGLFDLGEGSIFSKIIRGMIKLIYLPITLANVWVSMILSEGVKRTINDGIRNLADGMINGLINFINGLIKSVTEMLPDWIPGIGKARDFQIGNVDMSGFNVLMGTDSPVNGVYANEWSGRDLGAASNIAMYQTQ